MLCANCLSETASKVVVKIDQKGNKEEYCNLCGSVSSTWIPDVYWPGHAHTNGNITDRMGKPIYLESRRHKAQVMRDQGLSELGDRVHGTSFQNWKYVTKETKRA